MSRRIFPVSVSCNLNSLKVRTEEPRLPVLVSKDKAPDLEVARPDAGKVPHRAPLVDRSVDLGHGDAPILLVGVSELFVWGRHGGCEAVREVGRLCKG